MKNTEPGMRIFWRIPGLSLLWLSLAVSGHCSPGRSLLAALCPVKCRCTGIQAKCTGVREIPSHLPDNVEILLIENSPNLTIVRENAFQQYGANLNELRIKDTSVQILEKGGFNQLLGLKLFEISSASFLCNVTIDVFRDMTELETLIISDCPCWMYVEDYLFSPLTHLQDLTLSRNGIASLHANSFYGIPGLKFFSIAGNSLLEEIPRTAFQRLLNVEKIDVSDCALRVLYPEHVNVPYQLETLTSFNGDSNDWRCEQMCEFLQWLDDNNHFREIATLGYCASPGKLQTELVIELEIEEVCHEPMETVVLIVTVIFSSTLLLLLCYVVAARDGFVRKCCCDTRTPNATHRVPVAPTSARNRAAELSDDDTFEQEREDIGGWRITDIDPPSYDAITKSRIGVKIENQNSDVDSIDDIPPPAYEEHNHG